MHAAAHDSRSCSPPAGPRVPSPIGHALAGAAVGWAIAGRPADRRGREILLFAGVAIAPDLDLFAGRHSTYTHSVGAVLLVTALALVVVGSRHWRLAIAIGAAWGSHVLLDWLGSDTSPPIGITALWPFTSAYYQSSWNVFEAISRRYWIPHEFIWANLHAAVREIAILGPVAWLSWRLTRVRAGQS